MAQECAPQPPRGGETHGFRHRQGREQGSSELGEQDLDKTIAMAGTFVGTVTYMSPERCLGAPSKTGDQTVWTGQDYSFASDIWSIGMVIYELSTGRYPWADISSFPALFDHLCSQPEPRSVCHMASYEAARLDPEYFPAELIEFDAYCLTRDVSRRPEAWQWVLKWIAEDTEFLLARASD